MFDAAEELSALARERYEAAKVGNTWSLLDTPLSANFSIPPTRHFLLLKPSVELYVRWKYYIYFDFDRHSSVEIEVDVSAKMQLLPYVCKGVIASLVAIILHFAFHSIFLGYEQGVDGVRLR